MSVDEEKQQLRRSAQEGRGDWAGAAGAGAAERLADNFFRALPDSTGILAAYWPMADEIDVRPLISRLHDGGRAIALPVVVGKARPLIFRSWRPGLALESGGFGTRHPGPDEPEVTPVVMLVPLLAFDAKGHRLGWGGGFYDRTLARLRGLGPVIAVGVAYQAQLVDSVPHTANDETLDWVITDRAALEIPKQ